MGGKIPTESQKSKIQQQSAKLTHIQTIFLGACAVKSPTTKLVTALCTDDLGKGTPNYSKLFVECAELCGEVEQLVGGGVSRPDVTAA